MPRLAGPFAFQTNSTTRAYEYPWAFQAVPIRENTRVVDLGGSLAGFQFVLDRAGAQVMNVDAGKAAAGYGWPVTEQSISWLNRAFGTNVRLIPTTLQEAQIPTGSVDTVYSISMIEHIPPTELASLMKTTAAILRPGGHCVFTVDLFLNLHPFTDRTSNEWGTNISVKAMADFSGLELVVGHRHELLGYPEFEPRKILERLEEFAIGRGYPVLAQCLVLRKRAE